VRIPAFLAMVHKAIGVGGVQGGCGLEWEGFQKPFVRTRQARGRLASRNSASF
jgi:hypothetical protein